MFRGRRALVSLVAMTLLTTVDVVGRYFLNRPLAGAFELTELAMGAMVFFSLPLVTLRREQVTVDLLAGAVPVRWQRWERALFDLVAAACLVYTMALLAAVTVAVMVAMAWGDATGALEPPR